MSVLFLVSFLASIVGAICGIGGGVIIKPCLDLLQIADLATASFLSGCTVLSMSSYSVIRMGLSREKQVDMSLGIPLGIGAAAGGILGKQLFQWVKEASSSPGMVGAVQAATLALLTVGTLLYTLRKSSIASRKLSGLGTYVSVGHALGLVSSFLGIGGGPINLVVLYYCFGLDTKSAGANSLLVIFISQLASLLTTVLCRNVPVFRWSELLLMSCGGILGGIVGRALCRKMANSQVEKLFVGLLIMILLICVYNASKYLLLL